MRQLKIQNQFVPLVMFKMVYIFCKCFFEKCKHVRHSDLDGLRERQLLKSCLVTTCSSKSFACTKAVKTCTIIPDVKQEKSFSCQVHIIYKCWHCCLLNRHLPSTTFVVSTNCSFFIKCEAICGQIQATTRSPMKY